MNQTQTTELTVSGMTCQHCVNAVTEELQEVDGVQSVRVELVPDGDSSVFVASSRPLDRAAAKAAIDEAGYTVVG